MSQLHSAFTLFVSLLVEAMPFLMLGVILSSVLLVWVDERQLIQRFPKNPLLGAFMGSCIGFLFPVCECGNVPVARRFMLQGLPTSVAVGFLLSAPALNPVVIWSTWIAFRGQPEIVLYRMLGSLAIATIVGTVFSIQSDPKVLLQPKLAQRLKFVQSVNQNQTAVASVSPLLQSGTFFLGGQQAAPLEAVAAAQMVAAAPVPDQRFRDRLDALITNITVELRELGAVLIFGSAIAALIQVFVPREVVLSLGQGTVTSIVAMMLLAAIVSICSTVDSFFALSFASTFTTGSLLAFLIFGPMIDIKAIGLMLSIFKPRFILYLFLLAGQLTFLFALGYSYFL
ncbi:putative permease [[Synechococcus] sp. NIES-970]|uniref:permease n=1 Tax=Picosynechococcus sp. NKBG15041c TaxID=1407650 RepID=UPI000421A265|nr:permease [Picosynechococcus sp. NKBG15041c]BAW97320.1 putative permease [[Synechococcus] sp. NIES-970]